MRGVTLIELLVTIIIGSIAMMALAVPFMSERIFWNQGLRQTEAQRDAHMVLRAMARVARESAGYDYDASAPGTITFLNAPACGGGGATFERLPDGALRQHCGTAPPAILIDGVRSKVTNVTVTGIRNNKKLVRIELTVTHQRHATDPPSTQTLATELYLRNAI